MGWDSIGKMKEGAIRIFKLYKLVLDNKPSEQTQKFLNRLTRCYVWGFDAECIILCRAVIDTAFRDRIDDKLCEKYCNKNKNGFNLSNRIESAYEAGIIKSDIRTKAFKVKTRGDKAVHYQPDATKEVWETICYTLDILKIIA